MSGFFHQEGVIPTPFSALPLEAKKAIIWRWAIECEHDLQEKASPLLPDVFETP